MLASRPDSARAPAHGRQLGSVGGANVKAAQRMLDTAARRCLAVYSGLFDADLHGVAERLNPAAAL
jgi:hypothetical protein